MLRLCRHSASLQVDPGRQLLVLTSQALFVCVMSCFYMSLLLRGAVGLDVGGIWFGLTSCAHCMSKVLPRNHMPLPMRIIGPQDGQENGDPKSSFKFGPAKSS